MIERTNASGDECATVPAASAKGYQKDAMGFYSVVVRHNSRIKSEIYGAMIGLEFQKDQQKLLKFRLLKNDMGRMEMGARVGRGRIERSAGTSTGAAT
ncbi:hypothetical protein EVAR_80494_1 [Eumeta japonica]|uniref:Uncharacterized protein n=1 Tax=Eumeta variegata TaxID=151549 RepID=A0A4C1ZD68_EUMVA|nr:hypothetical protein EVAR_80494_1 [Eumeta japonica]